MKLLENYELEELVAKRPRLKEKLAEMRGDGELSLWHVDPVHDGGRRPLLLLARLKYSSIDREEFFLLSSQAGKDGGLYVWPFNPAVFHRQKEPQQPAGAEYVVIEKAKLGRKPRELTEEERQEILARREAGENINKIAKAMHLGTRRIMEALK